MVSLGPVPMPLVLLIVSVAIAAIVGRVVVARVPAQPSVPLFSVFFDMLLVGLIAGRLVFVLQYLPLYRADPWSVIRPGDGGYSIWAAVLAGLAFGAWRARRNEALRRPLAWGAVAGLGAWAALAGSLTLLEQAHIRLPEMQLTRLEGDPIQLSTLAGRPIVVNLWATWCPPCRREMPALAEGERAHPDVTFVFVNQGEAEADVRNYLRSESLQLQNVVLDPFSAVAQATGARGLPTTLFFDRDGRLVDTHVGELTRASLTHKLQRLVADPTQPGRR
jgi:thiol-disulfide isomerase/thioredoxin